MKKEITIFITSFLTFILFTSCSFGPGHARLSGEIISDRRDVPAFEAIDVSSWLNIRSIPEEISIAPKAATSRWSEIISPLSRACPGPKLQEVNSMKAIKNVKKIVISFFIVVEFCCCKN